MKDYTFSDGTFVPKGTFIAVASRAIHMDESIYPRANEFDPFRFSRMRAEDTGASGDMAPKCTMVSLGTNHVPFGYGKHAWCVSHSFAATSLSLTRVFSPGRFWAANVSKQTSPMKLLMNLCGTSEGSLSGAH